MEQDLTIDRLPLMDPEMRAQVRTMAETRAASRSLIAAAGHVVDGEPERAFRSLLHILRDGKPRPLDDVILAVHCLPYAVTSGVEAREAAAVLATMPWRRLQMPRVTVPPAAYAATAIGMVVRFFVKMGREMVMSDLPFYVLIAIFPLVWYVVARLVPVNRNPLRLACLQALARLEAPEGLALAAQSLGHRTPRKARTAARALVRALADDADEADYGRVGPHVLGLLAARAAAKRDWDLVQLLHVLGRSESVRALERLVQSTEPGQRLEMAAAALAAVKARIIRLESAERDEVHQLPPAQ